jgi:hypothetical protein
MTGKKYDGLYAGARGNWSGVVIILVGTVFILRRLGLLSWFDRCLEHEEDHCWGD